MYLEKLHYFLIILPLFFCLEILNSQHLSNIIIANFLPLYFLIRLFCSSCFLWFFGFFFFPLHKKVILLFLYNLPKDIFVNNYLFSINVMVRNNKV